MTDLAAELTSILPLLRTLLFIVGIFTTVWGGFLIVRKMMGGPQAYQTSWITIALTLMIGGGFTVGASAMTGLAAKSSDDVDPSPTPTLSPTVAEPSGNPITLPEIENPSAIWTWLAVAIAALGILVGTYFFIQKIHRDRTRKIEEENRRKEAEEKARQLAEEEASRQREAAEKRARIEARWATITDLHAELKRRIVDAETNWDTLFDLPALSDVSYRQTRALHRAMRDAENAVIPMPADFDEHTPMSRIPYVKKVHAFEDAWKVALAHAQKLGTSKLPDDEIRTIKRIRRLLIMAEGTGASEHERATAYEQIRKLIGELHVVQLPSRAIAAIESRQLLAITAGADSEPQPVFSVPRPMRAR